MSNQTEAVTGEGNALRDKARDIDTCAVLFDIDNMDAMESEDLLDLARVLRQYAKYAENKAEAVEARQEGRIGYAMECEKICDQVYQAIPQQFRRW